MATLELQQSAPSVVLTMSLQEADALEAVLFRLSPELGTDDGTSVDEELYGVWDELRSLRARLEGVGQWPKGCEALRDGPGLLTLDE